MRHTHKNTASFNAHFGLKDFVEYGSYYGYMTHGTVFLTMLYGVASVWESNFQQGMTFVLSLCTACRNPSCSSILSVTCTC